MKAIAKRIGNRIINRENIAQAIKVIFGIILVILFIGFVINMGIVPVTVVPTSSMSPTIMNPAVCLAKSIGYGGKNTDSVERGDVITFYSREEHALLCKRVIAIQGDTVSFEEGYVIINGEKQEESYLPYQGRTYCDKTFEVPEGSIFVLGDNRTRSKDSRYFRNPYIDVKDVKSRITYSFSLKLLR